jgi:hypothetical protein
LIECYGDNAQHVHAASEAATNAMMDSPDSDLPESVGEALESEEWEKRNAAGELEMLESKGT